MNNCDAASEAAKHLPEFKPDIAATEDNQVSGNFLKLHQRLVREVADRVAPGDARRSGTRSRIDENLIALENLVSHLHLFRREKTRYASIEAQLRMLIDAALLAIAETLHPRVLASHNRGKIHAYAACIDAPFFTHPRVVRHLGGSDHRLSGRAACVDAGAAEIRFFYESDGPT